MIAALRRGANLNRLVTKKLAADGRAFRWRIVDDSAKI